MNTYQYPFRRELPSIAPGAYSHALTMRQQNFQRFVQQNIQRSQALARDYSKNVQATAYNASQPFKKYR